MTVTTPAAQPAPPTFTPKRTLPAAQTWAEVTKALTTLQPGDRLPVQGVAVPKTPTIAKNLTGPAELVFDSGCKFAGGKGLRYPAFYFNSAYLRLIAKGMIVTNPTLGSGIAIVGANHCVLDGWTVEDCAGSAMTALPTNAPFTNNYIRATIRDWALVPSLDDHAEKGTGMHGLIVEDSHTAYGISGNTYVLTTPGSKMGGSLLEIGTSNVAKKPTGETVWLSAANLMQNAVSQTAGNALNLWGYLGTVDVKWIGATGLHGFALHSSPYGMYGGVKVEAGSAVDCCLNPRYRGQSPWQHNGGIVYASQTVLPAAA